MGPAKGIVEKTARWSARHPWMAIVVWVAFVAASLAGGLAVGTVHLTEGQEGSGESGRAERVIDAARMGDRPQEHVLIRRTDGSVLGSADIAVASDLGRRVAAPPAIERDGEPKVSGDRSAAVVAWSINQERPTTLEDIERQVALATTAHPELSIEQVGDLSIEKALEDAIGDDLGKAERLSIPITLGILVVVFGALIAAVVPLLLALSCVVAAVGLTAFASHVTPVSDAVTSVILLVGLAVGVDYSMFFMRRVRDERARGVTTIDAVGIAAATAGRAVVVSGLTVLVAMAGMFFSGTSIFASFAIGTMLVTAAAMISAITVLPALSARLGKWIDRPRVPLIHRLSRPGRDSRLWGAILSPVLRRPALALTVGAGALVALALPATGMTTKLLGTEDIPRSIPIMRSYDALTAAFPSDGGSHSVVIQAQDATAPAVRDAIDAMWRQVQASSAFAVDARPAVVVSDDRTVAQVTVGYPGGDDSATARQGLTELRERIVPTTVGRVAEVAVSGNPAFNRDFSDRLADRLPYVIGFVLALTFLLMLLSFRSVPIALVTVALNLLSVAAAYGLLVSVFQSTWAEDLLGFRSNGGIVAWLPLFLFVILFGLSMDYHVFVLSRIREGVSRGLEPDDAIRWGITSSAGVVTSAATVMAAVFAVFATLTSLEFKQLGVGLAAAVVIDATIVRGVLLPASLRLMGDRAWSVPRWLAWLPHVDHGSIRPVVTPVGSER